MAKEYYLIPIANLSSVVGRRYFRSNDNYFVQDVDGQWYTSDKRGEPEVPVVLKLQAPSLCSVEEI